MASAYRLDADAARIAVALGADPAGDVWMGGPVAPGGYAPVAISDKERGRILVPRLWGVPPPPRGDHIVPHVRNLDSPFWIGTLRHTQFRCLVPMTAFHARGGWMEDRARPVLAAVGIWRDSEIPSFAILTVEAMPVILKPQDFRTWLHADFKLARRLAES
ncbi:DUF159 family protein [Novosphingobium humi]|uniref:DUF159 family protein n=1 Tax=Novosphingobium humi TaxID=2282397 RepID=A0ABY7U000_9SPHN|nr:DUF159 family protein [Novosphingobium humi]WCT78847.1 DUF159 family protein [Novosphingobium humi]